MVDHNLLKQLNHSDPERRKKAVMELARTKDREALTYLATVYRSDSDPEVRELARKAGIYINKHTENGKAKNDSPIYGPNDDDDDSYYGQESDSYIDDEDLYDSKEKDVEVSALDAERANGLVKQAMDIHMRGNNDRALKYLKQALSKNPRLKKDSYTLSLASTITGMSGDQAIRYVLGDERKQKAKRGAGQNDPEDPTWGDAIVDLLIYGLVNTGLVIVGFFLVLGAFNSALANNPAAMTAITGSSTAPNTASLVGQLNAVAGTIMLIYSVLYGVGSMIGLFLFAYLPIHFVSVSFLSGEGTLTRLITKATIPMTVFTVVALVGGIGTNYLALVNPDMFGTATILSLVFSFGPILLLAQRIGVAYRFGMGSGCAAIFLGTIFLFVLFCLCSFLLPTILNGLS